MHKQEIPQMIDDNQNKSSSFVNGAFVGAIIGFAIGMLTAPDTGRENRKKLKQTSEELLETTKNIATTTKNFAEPLIEEAKPYVKILEEQAKPVIKETAATIVQLTEPQLEDIKKRMSKKNKNASARKFFKGNF